MPKHQAGNLHSHPAAAQVDRRQRGAKCLRFQTAAVFRLNRDSCQDKLGMCACAGCDGSYERAGRRDETVERGGQLIVFGLSSLKQCRQCSPPNTSCLSLVRVAGGTTSGRCPASCFVVCFSYFWEYQLSFDRWKLAWAGIGLLRFAAGAQRSRATCWRNTAKAFHTITCVIM